jgi:pimeloyl-ACP methyl ester carboxylesterase
MNKQTNFKYLMSLALILLIILRPTPLSSQTIPLEERQLPEVLKTISGERVTSSKQWMQKRRGEILELFRTYVYGRAPINRPQGLNFTVMKIDPKAMNGQATLKQVVIELIGPGGTGKVNLVLFVPNKRKKAAPAFLLICNRSTDNIDPIREKKSEFWPAEEIIARGYAAAAYFVGDIDPDTNDGFKNGVHGIYGPTKRSDDSWGTIAAWSWGASRVLDYLEKDADINSKQVAVVGHSRGGKAALWAGAQDERFALTISNNSGCTGAALARGKKGERIENINNKFPHWFCQNYKMFNGREAELPVDQHQLIALLAPRPAYIASASEDSWADPLSEFLSGVAASPVYELFGIKGLNKTIMPKTDSSLHEGFIGYHLRPGKHNLTLYDWQRFIEFADKRIKRLNKR